MKASKATTSKKAVSKQNVTRYLNEPLRDERIGRCSGCGNDSGKFHYSLRGENTYWWVKCQRRSCYMTGPRRGVLERAAEAWNNINTNAWIEGQEVAGTAPPKGPEQ